MSLLGSIPLPLVGFCIDRCICCIASDSQFFRGALILIFSGGPRRCGSCLFVHGCIVSTWSPVPLSPRSRASRHSSRSPRSRASRHSSSSAHVALGHVPGAFASGLAQHSLCLKTQNLEERTLHHYGPLGCGCLVLLLPSVWLWLPAPCCCTASPLLLAHHQKGSTGVELAIGPGRR